MNLLDKLKGWARLRRRGEQIGLVVVVGLVLVGCCGPTLWDTRVVWQGLVWGALGW